MELIKRLRVQAHENPVSLADLLSLCRKAADVIENLQTENAALRRAVDNILSEQAIMVKEFTAKIEELEQVKAERDAAKVDSVTVIRCRDCKYSRQNGKLYECPFFDEIRGDEFCSSGERKVEPDEKTDN